MKDVSDGNQLLGVNPGGGLQLTDGAAGYPTDHVFVLCSLNGLFYLQNQMPGLPSRPASRVGLSARRPLTRTITAAPSQRNPVATAASLG
jgi:hypothetical protein